MLNTVLRTQNNLAFCFCTKQYWNQTVKNSVASSRKYLWTNYTTYLPRPRTCSTTFASKYHLVPTNPKLVSHKLSSIPISFFLVRLPLKSPKTINTLLWPPLSYTLLRFCEAVLPTAANIINLALFDKQVFMGVFF